MKLVDVKPVVLVTVIKVPKHFRKYCKKGGNYTVDSTENKKVLIKLSDANHVHGSILIRPSLLLLNHSN